MGGGASVEIKHTHSSFMHVTDAHFQELLSSKKEREKLFADIAGCPVEGRKDFKDVITLLKLAAYFTNNANALYPGFVVNVDTLNAAFKYTIQKFRQQQSKRNKSSMKAAPKDKLTKAMFHSFLPTLLLFMRVWDVFDAADKLVVEDGRVFKGEFMRIKDKLNNVHGIVILGETPDNEWEKEFEMLDKNKDNFITFEETCTYALAHIKRPFDYSPEDDEGLLDEEDDEDLDGENAIAAPDSFVEVIASKVIVLAPEVPDAVAALPPPATESSDSAATVHETTPPKSPRSPRSPRSLRATTADELTEPCSVAVDSDVAAEEGEPLPTARILYV